MAYQKQTGSKRKDSRTHRHARIRSHLSGTAKVPRLAVFKSNRYIYAQIINDEKGVTIVSADSRKEKKGTMIEKSARVGEVIASLAKEKKINSIVFDRGGFYFTGHVKALADGARKGGLKF
ncbi:MAG: 50S ribosomal protein L18 [Patescibacteria group bacterium]